jgi:glycosyltransferase involved in cell wall biosynthesis
MRIAYVCNDPGIPVFGRKGASVHVQELLRAYRRLGHEVVLFTARPGGPSPLDLRDVEVVDIGRADTRDAARRELETIAIDEELQDEVGRRGDLDLVHERYSLWGGGGVVAANSTGRPSLLEVNAPLIEEQAAHRELVHRDRALARLRRAVTAASTVTAVSEPVARWVRERTRRRDGVRVLPNGVDLHRIRPTHDPADRPFTVGFVGTLKPWHGVDVLIDAMSELRGRVPHAQLLLVGDGPRADAVLAAARCGRVPVEHTGAVAPEQVPDHLARMDVACAPYPAGREMAYFSPLKVLEYLASGVPVVASSIGQIPELLDDGRCGVLVPPGDARALATALADLAEDPQRRLVLARRGRRHVERHHGWTEVASTGLGHAMANLPTVGASR